MNTEKKWMVTLDEETYKWVKSTADDLKIHGSDIIQELIRHTMKEKEEAFRARILDAHQRIRRAELEKRKAAIEEEIKDLSKRATDTQKKGH